MSAVEIEIVDDPGKACAAMLVGALTGSGQVVLAGGPTPRAAYQEFVRGVREAGTDLTGVSLWFGDERCVPPDDARSNYRMVKQTLLDPLGEDLPSLGVHRIQGEGGADAAAAVYEHELRSAGPPQFDLIRLGIGPDGHTASMFPDQASVSERSRLVVGVPHAGLEPFVPRVTMTLAAIALGRRVVVLASGETKAAALAAACGPDATPDPHVPSSMLASAANEITVLLDPAAAGKL